MSLPSALRHHDRPDTDTVDILQGNYHVDLVQTHMQREWTSVRERFGNCVHDNREQTANHNTQYIRITIIVLLTQPSYRLLSNFFFPLIRLFLFFVTFLLPAPTLHQPITDFTAPPRSNKYPPSETAEAATLPWKSHSRSRDSYQHSRSLNHPQK